MLQWPEEERHDLFATARNIAEEVRAWKAKAPLRRWSACESLSCITSLLLSVTLIEPNPVFGVLSIFSVVATGAYALNSYHDACYISAHASRDFLHVPDRYVCDFLQISYDSWWAKFRGTHAQSTSSMPTSMPLQ